MLNPVIKLTFCLLIHYLNDVFYLIFSDMILRYLLMGLQQCALASISDTALQSICTQCRDQMTNHLQGLMQIVQSMETFNLSAEAAIGLLKGELHSFVNIFELNLIVLLVKMTDVANYFPSSFRQR